jgi:RNA polymerase primary sigma factor
MIPEFFSHTRIRFAPIGFELADVTIFPVAGIDSPISPGWSNLVVIRVNRRPKRSLRSPLETYLREIKRTPLLNAEDEKELALRAEQGKSEAREKLVRANLRLVVIIARSYTGRGLDLQDLIEEGNLGLMRAVKSFDPALNTRFSTYASYWIKQAIRLALTNKAKTIRIPAYLVHLLARWQRTEVKLQGDLGRQPSVEEVADYLHLSRKRVDKLKSAMRIYSATPRKSRRGRDISIGETLVDDHAHAPDRELSAAEDLRQALGMLDELDSREAVVLRLRFGLTGEPPMTLETIGEVLGLTRERVRQIQCEALRNLRRRMETVVGQELYAS